MSMTSWSARVAELSSLLSATSCRDAGRATLAVDEGFRRWADAARAMRDSRNTAHLIGNGASASMASHFAADLAKNAAIRTHVFSDLSLITAMANDLGYVHVFAEPLRQHAEPGDMLVAISSSGRSPNILAAVNVARERKLTVVTLSGMSPDNPLRQAGDLNFHVAAGTYGDIETCHAAILHHWLDMLELPRPG